jgi:prevent-host-death family protein
MTKHWALQDAKARLSELVRDAANEPQHITVRGEATAVVISEDEYRRLAGKPKGKKARKTLYEILRSCPYALEIPPRKRERDRDIGL